MSKKSVSSFQFTGSSIFQGCGRSLVLGLFVLLCASAALAQLTTGTISGTVMDPSGAAVPGAAITVKNVDTGASRSLVSGPTGRYEAPNLPAGNYEVSATLAGFQTTVRKGIEVAVGRTGVVDLSLQVGEVTQSVTVTGEVPLVETTSATVANLVDEKKVADLPLNGRDLTQLSFLQPGVIKVPRSGEQTVFGGMGDNLTVGGSRSNQNVYLLDGVSNSDLSGNAQGASGAYIGAETVKEFQIITNNYSAEYRSQAGAIVSAVTKSGANTLHGSGFWTLRNDNLDAAKWEDNALTGIKPEFKRNQFGGSLGGPIIKDKTFFFGSYEGLRERLSTTDEVRVPSLLMRQGILPGRTVTVNPAMRPYLDLWALPGRGNSLVRDYGDGTVLVAGTMSQPTNDDYVAARFDHQFASQKAGFLSGTYNFDDSDRSPFGVQGDVTENTGNGGGNGSVSRKHVIAVSHNSVWSPTMLNEFKFGYSFTENGGDHALTSRDFSNISFNPNRKLVGQLVVGDLDSVGFRVQGSTYQQKSFSFKEGVSLTRGNHSFRAGVDIDRYRYFQNSCSRGCNGIYTFANYANLLLGVPRRFEGMLPGGESPPRNLRQLLMGAYFQDNWRVRPSFTLNLGLRYEFTTVPKEDDEQISNLVNFQDSYVSVPDSIKAKYPGQPFVGTLDQFFTNPTLKSFSPRFGFAWAPGSKKTSLRGGFGIFYEHPMLYAIRTAMQELPPYVLVGRLDATATRPVNFPNAYTTQTSLLRGRPNIRAMEYDQKTAYIYRWSLTLQRELGTNWVVSAGYTGSRALHLWQQGLPNIRKWDGWPNSPTGEKHWTAGAPLIQPNFGEIRIQAPNANSFFHGLGVGLQKRLSQGLQVQLAYNFSKAIDQGSGVTSGGDELPQTQRGIYFWDMNLKKSLAAFDIRNTVSANFTYEFPMAQNLTGAAGAVLKGWQWNGILTLTDGHPLTVFDEQEAQNTRIGDNENLRADLIAGGNNNPVLGGPNKYYDPSQFAPSRVGFFGNVGPGTVTSPGIATFDFSLLKNFPVAEGKRFQFRAEFFNLLNRPNFGTPDMTPFLTTATRDQWERNPASALDTRAGRVDRTATSARQIQFGLKFIF